MVQSTRNLTTLNDRARSQDVGHRRQANTAIMGITIKKAVAIIGRRYSWSAGQTAESWSMAEESESQMGRREGKSEGQNLRRYKVEGLKGGCRRSPCAEARGTRRCLVGQKEWERLATAEDSAAQEELGAGSRRRGGTCGGGAVAGATRLNKERPR